MFKNSVGQRSFDWSNKLDTSQKIPELLCISLKVQKVFPFRICYICDQNLMTISLILIKLVILHQWVFTDIYRH